MMSISILFKKKYIKKKKIHYEVRTPDKCFLKKNY